ncbi:MAG: TRAP transporter small permease [Brevinema sp.]
MNAFIAQIQKNITSTIFLILQIIMAVMVIMVVGQVFSRYVLSKPNQLVEEILRFSLIWAVMLGSVACFVTNEHIALTLLLDSIKEKNRIWVQLIIDLLVISFVGLVMIYGGIKMSLGTMKQLTPLLQIPMGTVYTIIPISGVMILFVKVLQIIQLFTPTSTIDQEV